MGMNRDCMIIGNYIECFNERIYSFSKHVSCLLQGGVRALMCAPLMLPESGAWAEVSQLLQWFVNDIYPCYSRVLRVY